MAVLDACRLVDQAIAGLDIPNMVVGLAYSVPIEKGAGASVQPKAPSVLIIPLVDG